MKKKMQIHFTIKRIDNSTITGRKEIDKDERVRKISGEKRRLAKKEECTAHRVQTLCRFFESYHVRIFLFSKKVEIIKKRYRIGC